MLLSIAVIVGAAFLVAPRAASLCLFVPVMGTVFGGFCWALVAMVWPSLVSLEAFAGSVAMASVVTAVLALRG